MVARRLLGSLAIAALVAAALPLAPRESAAAQIVVGASPRAQTCTSSVGPGIPPPGAIPSGQPGFHASWYGQSGYPTLCPGDRSTAVVAYYNSGTRGWVSGRLGEMAFLGTWDPLPGQDNPSSLGGDGTNGSPATGWPRYNRVAAQPADYVGPNQVSWFQFTIQAPQQPGTYRLYIRPLVEGANWMEDFGVFWQVNVKAPDLTGVLVSPTIAATQAVNTTRTYTAQANGITGCLDLAFVDANTYAVDGSFRDAEVDSTGKVVGDDKADLSTAATFSTVNGVQKGTSYVDCVVIPPSGTIEVTVTSTSGTANVRPIFFQDLNNNNALDLASTNLPTEIVGVGAPVRFIPPGAASSSYTVTVGGVNTDEDYFVDSAGTKTFRYDSNDSFQLGSMTLTLAQFEQLLSTGDGVTMTYSAESIAVSTFTITNDVGRGAPTLVVSVDDYDNENVQDDLLLTITEPATNMDDLVYQIWGTSVTALGPSCETSSQSYAARGTATMPRGQDTVTWLDRQLPSGIYCYRAGLTNPVTGQTVWGYGNFVTVETPPTPVGPNADPRSLDARVTTVAGLANTFDAGDVIKIGFSKDMKLAAGATIRATDGDGTFADIVCGTSGNASCALNGATETLGGTPFGPKRVLTVTLTASPTTVQAGSSPGLQLPAPVSDATGITDLAGNPWDVLVSPDGVLGAPD